MGIQDMIKAQLSTHMSTFDSENIVIGGETVPAVMNETDKNNGLKTGEKSTNRELVVQFSTADYSSSIRSGEAVTARGETWQVSPDPGAIRRGQAAITLLLIEPERRETNF